MSWRDSLSDEHGRFVLEETTGELGVTPLVITVPGNRRWLLLSVNLEFSTPIGAGARRARLEVVTDGVVTYRLEAPLTQGVGEIRTYGFYPGVRGRAVFVANFLLLVLPKRIILNEAAQIRCDATNFTVNDVWNTFSVCSQEWLQRV